MVAQDTLVTVFRLDAQQYQSSAAQTVSSTNAVSDATRRLTAAQQAQDRAARAQIATFRQSQANYGAFLQQMIRQHGTLSAAQNALASRIQGGGGGGSFGNMGTFAPSTVKATSGTVKPASFLYKIGQGIGRNAAAAPYQDTRQVLQGLRTMGGNLGSFLGGQVRNPFKTWRKDASSFFDSIRDGTRDAVQAFAPLRTLVGTIFGVGVAGAVGGWALMKQGASFDSLRMSLVAVEGDATKAGNAIARLKNLAKAPGLGFEEAVRAYGGLRNAGMTQQFAESLIREFANANAMSGGGVETFDRIMLQAKQAANRAFLSNEDLNPMAEAGIPIYKILKDRFGTSDTEELRKKGISGAAALEGIVEQLSKLRRVAGGEQNEIDNLGDAWKFAGVSAGAGLNQGLMPYVSQFTKAVGSLTEGGEIEAAFANAAEIMKGAFGGDNDAEGVADTLRGILVATQDTAAFTRNLVENARGAADWWENINEKADRFASRVKAIGSSKTAEQIYDEEYRKLHDNTDLSAAAEHKRNVQNVAADKWLGPNRQYLEWEKKGVFGKPGTPHPGAQNEFRQNYKDPEYQRYLEAVENGDAQPGTWKQWKESHKDGAKGADANKKANGAGTKAKTGEAKTVSLLERIAINTGRMVEQLEDAQSGGGSLTSAQSAIIELQGITGGYNRRFRRMNG